MLNVCSKCSLRVDFARNDFDYIISCSRKMLLTSYPLCSVEFSLSMPGPLPVMIKTELRGLVVGTHAISVSLYDASTNSIIRDSTDSAMFELIPTSMSFQYVYCILYLTLKYMQLCFAQQFLHNYHINCLRLTSLVMRQIVCTL